MLLEDLSGILAEHPFVKGIDSEHIKFLTGCATNVKFQPGEYLFREGALGRLLYLVRDGEASVQVYAPGAGATTVATVRAGEIAGWSWVVTPYISHFDVVVRTPLRALSLDAECLRNKCQIDPAFGYEMLTRMVTVMEQQLLASRLQVLDLYGRPR